MMMMNAMAMPAAVGNADGIDNDGSGNYGNAYRNRMMLLSGGGLDAGLVRPGAIQSPGSGLGSSEVFAPVPAVLRSSPSQATAMATMPYDEQWSDEVQVRAADRLAQSLAELALEPERDQYPIDIVLVPATGLTLRDLALRRLAAVLPPPAMLPEQRVDAHYLALLAQLARPPGAPPLTIPPGVTAGMLPQYQIEPAGATGGLGSGRPHETPFQVVDIVRAISSGTAQGTVYDVEVMLPRAGGPGRRNVDLARAATAAAAAEDRGVHTALVRRGPDGPVTAVHAALKKSPIYSVGTWLARAAVQRLIDARRATDTAPLAPRRSGWWRDAFAPGGARAAVNNPRYGNAADARLASWFARAADAVRDVGGPDLPPTLVAAPVSVLERLVAQMDRSLDAEFANANNDAYIDAVGAFLGSQLAESGVSPFFGLLYATLRATDAAFFDPNGAAVNAIGPEINVGFPVQATIMQFLDGTLGGLIESGFFAGTPAAVGPARDYEKAMALAAQVVFGLAAAQGAYGIVHNDFHNDNIAYENVPDDVMLYYRTEPADPGQAVRYYAVPTFGKVYKMIDFGRATFRLGEEMRGADASARGHAARMAPLWGSPTQDAVVEGQWNLRGFNNDLLRFVTVFLYNLGARADATPAGPADPWREAFMRMARHVTSCAPPEAGPAAAAAENPLAWVDRCSVLPGDMTRRRRCASDALSVRPYLVDSPCVNAVPADNVHWFDGAFGIDRSEIPAGAHVYSIPM